MRARRKVQQDDSFHDEHQKQEKMQSREQRGQAQSQRRWQEESQRRKQEIKQCFVRSIMLLAAAFVAYFIGRLIFDTSWKTGMFFSLSAHAATIMLVVQMFTAVNLLPGRSGRMGVTYICLLIVCFAVGLLVWQLEAMHAVNLSLFAGNYSDAPLVSFSERSKGGKLIFCITTGVFGPPYFTFVLGRDLFYWTELYLLAAVTKVVSHVIAHIMDAIAWVLTSLKPAWQAVMRVISLVIASISNAVAWVLTNLQSAWRAVAEAVIEVVSLVIAPILNAVAWVLTSLQSAWRALAEVVTGVVSLVIASIAAVFLSIAAGVKDVFSMLRFR